MGRKCGGEESGELLHHQEIQGTENGALSDKGGATFGTGPQ